MSFLSPWFLLGLAAVAAPLVLHLFARENAPVRSLPTVRFVPRAEVQQTARRQLQEVPLLLLRVLAILLLAFAFARPFLERAAAGSESGLTVVAVDRSFSMGGADREPRWRRAAREAVDAVPSGGRVALVAFDREAEILVAPTSSRGEVVRAIDRLSAGHGSTSYASALRAGVDLARGRPARLVIVSDGQRAGLDAEPMPAIPSTLQLSMRTVPPPAENLAVDILERNDAGLFALVANHGLADRRARVDWRVDGAPVAERFVEVPAQGAAEVRLERPAPQAGVVSVSVDDPAGYAADNVRYYVADPPQPLPVFLVEGLDSARDTGLYVRAALEASNGATPVFAVTRVRADDARLSTVEGVRAARALVLIGTRGLVKDARVAIAQAVQNGVGLVVAAGPEVEAGVVRELLGDAGPLLVEGPQLAGGDATGGAVSSGRPGPGPLAVESTLVAADLRHPVLAALGSASGNLGQVRVERAWSLGRGGREAGGTTIIALSSGGPALTEITVGQGRAFLFSTDLGRLWNTWPLHPTFVPTVVESVRHAGKARARVRDLLIGDIAGDAGRRPGVAMLAPGGPRVAINVDPREGRVDAVTADEFVRGVERIASGVASTQLRREAEADQRWWRAVLWSLLAVLAIEALVASRARSPSRGARPAVAAAYPGDRP